jgi:hypothetical protein
MVGAPGCLVVITMFPYKRGLTLSGRDGCHRRSVRINNRYFRYMSSTKRLNVCSFFRIFVGYVGKKLYLCSVEPKNGADLS